MKDHQYRAQYTFDTTDSRGEPWTDRATVTITHSQDAVSFSFPSGNQWTVPASEVRAALDGLTAGPEVFRMRRDAGLLRITVTPTDQAPGEVRVTVDAVLRVLPAAVTR